MRQETHLPLFPLPNVVHFPQTDLWLHVFEPRYRRMVRDLAAQEKEGRLIGMVLIKPRSLSARHSRNPGIYPEGTAGRLVRVDPLGDGRSNILLHGEFRFRVERELDSRPYRQAVVQRIDEPRINQHDPGVTAMRSEVVELCVKIAREVGENFPLRGADLLKLQGSGPSFEELINALAANLDMPILGKFELLTQSLLERGQRILSILRSQQRVLDFLRPYRHLAPDVGSN